MQMTGEQRVAAPRQKVWEALNDPEILRQSIPGCQSLDKEGDDRFAAVAEVKIGPIGARFKGQVQLTDLDAPNGYRITGSGNGGIAGSAKGGAVVKLSDAPGGGTLVSYTVEAEVGGRMAQLGGPIIDATAKNLAGKFFEKFGQVVGGQAVGSEVVGGQGTAAPVAAVVGEAVAPAAASVPIAPASRAPAPLWGWVVALVCALFVGDVIGRSLIGPIIFPMAVALIVTAAAAYAAGRHVGGRS